MTKCLQKKKKMVAGKAERALLAMGVIFEGYLSAAEGIDEWTCGLRILFGDGRRSPR